MAKNTLEVKYTPREIERKLVEVHVAGACIRLSPASEHGEEFLQVLVAKRKPSRELYPGLLEGCGYFMAFEQRRS
jgi:hypothetical protein